MANNFGDVNWGDGSFANPPVVASFTSSASGSVAPGTSVTLSWMLTGGTPDSVTIDNGVGDVSGVSSFAVTPTVTTTYRITATNGDGSSALTVQVTITGSTSTPPPGTTPSAPVINSFTSSASTSTAGAAVTLTFDVTGADQLSIEPDVPGGISGTSVIVNPTSTTTFTLTATNSAGSVTATVTVVVRGSTAENIRYHQIRRQERHGDDSFIQMSDGTGVDGHVAVFKNQNVTDGGGFPVLSPTPGASSGDEFYGQVPRGERDGSRVLFQLDYTVANPHTILTLNGSRLAPIRDGDGTDPTGVYSIDQAAGTLTLLFPPLATDGEFNINYMRGLPITQGTPPPPSPITTWTLVAITAFQNNALNTSEAFIANHAGPAFEGGIPFFGSTSTYSKQTNTCDLTGTTEGILFNADTTADQLMGYVVNFCTQIYQDAAGLETLDDQASISVYDCYVQATRADSTTTIYRPTSFVVNDPLGMGAAGLAVCDDPGFAIDTDDTTAAVLHNHAISGLFWTLSTPNSLAITGFTAV